MKKLIFTLSFIMIFLGNSLSVDAVATPVSTSSATVASPSARTLDLLDRVASKVAEMTDKLRRAYSGKIKSIGSSTLVVTTQDQDRSVLTNDATMFFRVRGGKTTETTFSALKIGDDVSAVGTVDPQNSEMTAKQVVQKIQRISVVGKITKVEKAILTVKLAQEEREVKIDINSSLSLKKINPTKPSIDPSINSDFKVDTTVIAICYETDKNSPLSVLKAISIP